MDGLVDFMFTDRRDKFDMCKYWEIDKTNSNKSKLEYLNVEPSGLFYAKLYSPQSYDKNIVGGVFMFDEETTSIISNDDLSGIMENYIVEFRGNLYRVDSVSKRQLRKTNQFNDIFGYSYVLNLKR
ncbi:MAG: hypothetical protein IKF82_01255 [Bacilli bacterium]|nr:hypothetical protein [Bacilli bacterium]